MMRLARQKQTSRIRGVPLSATLASLTWLFVDLFDRVRLQNRLLVLIRWRVSFATRGPGAPLITGHAAEDARPTARRRPA
jgi:hypothetical protein